MAQGGSFESLQRDIEQLVQKQGRPVVVVAAGLGARYLSLFLQRSVSESWTAQHVAGIVSVSGARLEKTLKNLEQL